MQFVQNTTFGLWEKTIAQLRKNVPQNTNKHTCDMQHLHYFTLLIYLHWVIVCFWEWLEKNIHRKTLAMDSLFACNFIKKWFQYRCFPVNFAKLSITSANRCCFFWLYEQFFWCNKVLSYPCCIKDEPYYKTLLKSRTSLKKHFIKICYFLILECCLQFCDNFLLGSMKYC